MRSTFLLHHISEGNIVISAPPRSFDSYIIVTTMKLAGFILLPLYVPLLPLSIFVITIHHFLLQHSFTFSRPLSPLCHHQSAVPRSHVIPSPYHLLFLHYSTSSSSSLSSPPLLPSQKSLLPFLLHFLHVCRRRRHRPLAVFLVFTLLIITLITPLPIRTVPEALYLYVLDVLYSIKAVC